MKSAALLLAAMLAPLPCIAQADPWRCDDSAGFEETKRMFPYRPLKDVRVSWEGLPYRQEARILCAGTVDDENVLRFQREEGTLPDGTTYWISYQDGSARFEKDGGAWAVSCSKDSMEDTISCSVMSDLVLHGMIKGGSSYVLVGADRTPGTTASIRLDAGKPFHTTDKAFSGSAAVKIADGLQTCGKALYRYTPWPKSASEDREVGCGGFKAAREYAAWALKRIT